MDYQKVYVMSYKIDGQWNPISTESISRFRKQGFKTQLIEGYNLKQHPEFKRNEIVYRNLLDKVIPFLIKKKIKSGVFVAEDDAYPNDFVTPEFLRKRITNTKYANKYKNKILRVGYQKVIKEKKNNQVVLNCVGNQLLWIPKSQLQKLEEIMKQTKPQHLNGFFSKNIDIDVELLDAHVQISKKTKYVLEIEHNSLTMNRTRKGKRHSSIMRNNKRSSKLSFFNSQNNQPARIVPKKSKKNS
jgi:hypothetical protein